jgi:cyclase
MVDDGHSMRDNHGLVMKALCTETCELFKLRLIMRPSLLRGMISGLLAVGLLAWTYSAAHGLLVPTETKVSEIAPGVFFRKAQTEPVFTGCNQGWVVFRDFVLVIDANFPGPAEEVIKKIRETTDKPIRFVFDTHHHGDHADGTGHYVKQGATAIAHERSRPLFETKGAEGFQNAKKGKPEEYSKLAYEIPALYFDHKFVIDDGTQRVELLHFGHGHTLGDAVAWLPKQGILFTGDACVNGAFNYTGESNTETWIAALTAMHDLPVKTLCPGHGEMGTKEVIENQRRYFVELRKALQTLIADGKSLAQIKQEISLPFYKEWAGVDVKTREENIEHVHRELTKK